jgi:hypothetical protein
MKKNLRPYEITAAIRKQLIDTDGIIFIDRNESETILRRPTDKGYFKILLTTNCEGNVIGTVTITYVTKKNTRTEEYDVHSEFVCNKDNPDRIVRNILNHSDPAGIDDYESLIPVCPHCGSLLIDENYPHTDKEGNYITCEFVCCECQCEFDIPIEKEVK